jgi:Flp pilus assembly CpaF family ATPase|tara:strand:+ start:514 stop:708 length:195 start_codon:yes stop_codon:yes gene_type:complete
MIDYLTFIEELKKIRETNNTRFADPGQTNKVIDKTVEKYENMIDEFEKDQENQQKLTLDNTVIS